MPNNNVKTPKDEKLWSKAKGIVEKDYKDVKKDSDRYWALVNGIYQTMKGKKAMSLRDLTIRLAHANPELRPHLLPLIKQAEMAWQTGQKGSGGVWETGERVLFEAPEGTGSQVPPARDRDGVVLEGTDKQAASAFPMGRDGGIKANLRSGALYFRTQVSPHGLFAGELGRPANRGRRTIARFMNGWLGAVKQAMPKSRVDWALKQERTLLDVGPGVTGNLGIQFLEEVHLKNLPIAQDEADYLRASLVQGGPKMGFKVTLL